MAVTGPDFVALQVRDLDASARFYTERLGLARAPVAPPGAVVLVALEGVHEHYTLIRAHSAASWLLYDSGGLARLPKAGCGSPRSHKRHRIDAASVEIMTLMAWGGGAAADRL